MTPLAFLATVFTALRGLLPLVIVLALLSSGCTIKAYEGPELPRSEIAVLDAGHVHGRVLGLVAIIPIPAYKHKTSIAEIDGKTKGPGTEIHVLPGQHSVRVFYQRFPDVALCGYFGCIANYSTSDLSIDFTVEAGHEYRIPAERRGQRNWIWVEDVKSGKVVAGEKPPDDKGKGKYPAKPSE